MNIKDRFYRIKKSIFRDVTLFLKRRVTLVKSDRRDLIGALSNRPCLVEVIGNTLYSQTRERYPISNRRELEKVLRLRQEVIPDELHHIGVLDVDGRWVTSFKFRDFSVRTSQAFVVIPETLLLGQALAPGEIFEVNISDERFYVGKDGAYQRSGGLISSAEIFLRAAGLPATTSIRRIDSDDQLRTILATGLLRLPLTNWLSLTRPGLLEASKVAARPILTASVIAAFIYMSISSIYLESMVYYRNVQLARLTPSVEPLLAAEKLINRSTAAANAMTTQINRRSITWPMWEIIEGVWLNKGFLLGVAYRDDELIVRAAAPDALVISEYVAKIPWVISVDFSSGVIQRSDSQQEFSLLVRFTDPSNEN